MSQRRAEPRQTSRVRPAVGVHQGGKQFESIHRAIAKAALVELSEHGFDRLDAAAVATRAAVSERTVYRHFPTKSELAVAGIMQISTFEGWADGDDAIAARFRRGLAIGAAHRDYLAPVLATSVLNRTREPQLLATLEAHVMKGREEQIDLLIADGQRSGEIRKAVRGSAIAAAIDGLLIAHHRGTHPLGTGKRRVARIFNEIWPLMATDAHLDD